MQEWKREKRKWGKILKVYEDWEKKDRDTPNLINRDAPFSYMLWRIQKRVLTKFQSAWLLQNLRPLLRAVWLVSYRCSRLIGLNLVIEKRFHAPEVNECALIIKRSDGAAVVYFPVIPTCFYPFWLGVWIYCVSKLIKHKLISFI